MPKIAYDRVKRGMTYVLIQNSGKLMKLISPIALLTEMTAQFVDGSR